MRSTGGRNEGASLGHLPPSVDYSFARWCSELSSNL